MEITTRAGPALAELARPQPGRGGRGNGEPSGGEPGGGEPGGAGQARAERGRVERAAFLLVLTHGAGGGVGTPDLLAAQQAGLDLGGAVARVVQPYRVRGARAPGSAAVQDAAWLDVVTRLRGAFPAVPLIQGGRSNGARVACRTALAARALGVLALAFPLHPPGRPARSRATELAAAGTPVLVINGDRDPFGVPAGGGAVRVCVLAGETHALAGRPGEVGRLVRGWLPLLLASRGGTLTAGGGGTPRGTGR